MTCNFRHPMGFRHPLPGRDFWILPWLTQSSGVDWDSLHSVREYIYIYLNIINQLDSLDLIESIEAQFKSLLLGIQSPPPSLHSVSFLSTWLSQSRQHSKVSDCYRVAKTHRMLEVAGHFSQRATNYRALLRKMTCKDKASYESSPPCNSVTTPYCTPRALSRLELCHDWVNRDMTH